MGENTEQVKVTLTEDTRQYLTEEFPDSLSIQEAIRTAISRDRIVNAADYQVVPPEQD